MPSNLTNKQSNWEPRSFENAQSIYDIAHARAGDKGDIANIVVIPFDDENYSPLLETLTAERVENHFEHLITGSVTRYPIPNLYCINFVLTGALDGGVTRSLRFDRHGKTLSRHLLSMPIDGEDIGRK